MTSRHNEPIEPSGSRPTRQHQRRFDRAVGDLHRALPRHLRALRSRAASLWGALVREWSWGAGEVYQRRADHEARLHFVHELGPQQLRSVLHQAKQEWAAVGDGQEKDAALAGLDFDGLSVQQVLEQQIVLVECLARVSPSARLCA